MDTVKDFEDILSLFKKYRVNYLIIGGLAFIFHAKPRYTKDIDIWVQADDTNIKKANRALEELGSPVLISLPINFEEIVQLGVAPNRIDILLTLPEIHFKEVWKKRLKSPYGNIMANWIDLDSLIKIKKNIKNPRHAEDARILMQVKKLKTKKR